MLINGASVKAIKTCMATTTSEGMEFPPGADAIDSRIIVKFKSNFAMPNSRVSSPPKKDNLMGEALPKDKTVWCPACSIAEY